MKLKLFSALVALFGATAAQEQIPNPDQLEEKVALYWTAFVERDYMAAYKMYPAASRSEISYSQWLGIMGLSDEQYDRPAIRLASIEIKSISRPSDPNFSHMCEVFIRLRIELQDGTQEEGLVSNVWEMDDSGNWAPSMPLALGP